MGELKVEKFQLHGKHPSTGKFEDMTVILFSDAQAVLLEMIESLNNPIEELTQLRVDLARSGETELEQGAYDIEIMLFQLQDKLEAQNGSNNTLKRR